MFEPILAALDEAFRTAAIPYMVIGGQAVLIYGEPRLTRDVDVTLGVGSGAAGDVLVALSHLPIRALVHDVAAFAAKTMALPLLHEPSGVRIDLIFSFSPYEQEALGRAQEIKIGTANVRFISLDDLIVHKVVAGRPRDLEDVRSILRKNPAANRISIREHLRQFTEALGEDLVARFDALS